MLAVFYCLLRFFTFFAVSGEVAMARGSLYGYAGYRVNTFYGVGESIIIGNALSAGSLMTAGAVGVKAATNSATESLSFINNSSRASHAGGINLFKDGRLRAEMGNSIYGQRVLQAADSGEINLTFSTSPSGSLYGGSLDNHATVYLENTQHGYTYNLLGVKADGYQFSAGVGIHEGLHSLGVAGSRRAEALVRLAELDNLGVAIDKRAMRQVLTDMGSRKNGPYSGLPWSSGGSTPNFPELKF